MEFTEEQWHGLKQHADERGILFLSSPFSLEAVSLLERVGVAAWKVASGEASNPLLVARLAKTRLPVLLSTGMSSFSEIDSAVAKIKSFGAPLAVLQCTSSYPCGPEKIGLNVIRQFRERYQTCVGLSDHSGTIFPGLAAAVLGIEVLEVHVTLSREMFGPDVASSLTTAELGQLVEGVRFIETMRASNVDKDAEARELTPLRNMFTRSVTVRCDLPAGNILREDQLTLKKPGTGIRPERLKELVGRKLRRAITAETLLSEDDID
jgi:N-acetylneuraminate synthase